MTGRNTRHPEASSTAPSPLDTLDFLAGGGEMGARIRAHNWAATPLGPVEGWPQSLRSATRLVLDSHLPMCLAWGRNFVHVYNDACRPIFGPAKHPAALGRSPRESFPEVWDVVRPVYERIMADGEPVFAEDVLSSYDRHGYVEETYVTVSDSALRDESGGVGGVLVTLVETTERVLAERRLRALRDLGAAAMEATSPDAACATVAEILHRNALDLPFALLYLTDARGTVARRVGLSGLPPAHAAAPADVALDDHGAAGWPLAEVVANGSARLVDDVRARFGVLDCGPWPEKPHSALVLPIVRTVHERPTGVLVAGISGRRALDVGYRDFLQLVAGHVATAVSNARAHDDERRRAEALAELDRAKTAFFSNVSHEFRTPLTLLLGPLEQMLAEPARADAAPARELLRTAHRNGLRLLKLVNALLDFTRLEAGRVEASFEPVDLPAYTRELASAFRSAAESAGLRFVVDCPPLPDAAGPVYVDRELWERVVFNLLSNALKFTFGGEIAVALHAVPGADATDAGWSVALTVRDTGVGIPPGELPYVFERFHRVRGARGRTHEGTGIGLALVRDLARLHGGGVDVASAMDAGSAFTVTIPAGAAHLPAEQLAAPRPRAPAASGAALYVDDALGWTPAASAPDDGVGGVTSAPPPDALGDDVRGARVVLVDDNADMRAYLTRLLAPSYAVEAYASSRAALAAVARRPPALVLADVMMPELDGFGLLRALRADPRTRPVPVILLSARAGEAATVEGLDAGADDYLVKPFSTRELLARVRAQLTTARLRARLASTEERERLARELHDSVAQTLIAADLLAGSIAPRWERGHEAVLHDLARLSQMTRGAAAEMRVLLMEMRPELLGRATLGSLLRQLAEVAAGRAGFVATVHVDDRDPHRLPDDVRLAVYRVAQESLNNVWRHARAARVDVVVVRERGRVELRVRDDGRGLPRPGPATGFGLTSMRERAAAVGAALSVDAAAGGGTEVVFRWPAEAGAC